MPGQRSGMTNCRVQSDCSMHQSCSLHGLARSACLKTSTPDGTLTAQLDFCRPPQRCPLAQSWLFWCCGLWSLSRCASSEALLARTTGEMATLSGLQACRALCPYRAQAGTHRPSSGTSRWVQLTTGLRLSGRQALHRVRLGAGRSSMRPAGPTSTRVRSPSCLGTGGLFPR